MKYSLINRKEKIMWILLDLILVAVFAFCIYRGYKKGFIKSCLGLGVTLLSVVITVNIYSQVGGMIRETVVYDNLKNNLKETIENHIDTSNDPETVSNLFSDAEEKSPSFEKTIRSFNFTGKQIAAEIDKLVAEGKEFTVDIICSRIVEQAAVFISNAVAIILVFLLSTLVLTLVVNILNCIFKLPVLRIANRALGFLIGAVKGIIYVFIIVGAVKMALPYLDGSGISITEKDVEKTVVFSALDNIDIIGF